MALQSQKVLKYSRLPRDEHEKPQSSSRRTRFRCAATILGCLFAILLSGSWVLNRLSGGEHGQLSDPEQGTKALVIASTKGQDVAWLDNVPTDWRIYRYFTDDPHPPNNLSVPRNQGREAMVYLTYIIDHYDDLPDYVAFVHGHQRSWHQVEPISAKVKALNLTALDHENYISFRCGDQMGCEKQPYLDVENVNWDGERHLRDFWHSLMPNEALPRYISYKCCGQHAATSRVIRQRSLNDWIRVRSPLLRDPADIQTNEVWGRGPPVADEWLIGTFYEKLWHVLFGQGGEYCPSVEHCRQVHFSNAITCDGDIDLTLFDGDAWKEVVCASAFDGLAPDEPANLTSWTSLIGKVNAGLRRTKARVYTDTKDKLADAESRLHRLEELEHQALEWNARPASARPAPPHRPPPDA